MISKQTRQRDRKRGGKKKKQKKRERERKRFFFSLLRLKSDNASGATASKNARRLIVAQPPRCYRTEGYWCGKSTAQNFEKIGRKSGINGVRYDKQTQCIIIRKKITATRACRRDYTHTTRSGRLQDERERETEGGRETRGCLWTVREPRGCRFFATARFSPNSGHSDICLLRISSSPDRQFVDVEFSFHIWIQDLSSISEFRTYP